jgi:hypothetical protein
MSLPFRNDSEPDVVRVRGALRWLLPSLHSFCVLAVLSLLIGGSWRFLIDSDTGWHIRTGEWIWQTGTAPREDLFSYTMQGHPWFAWEWLSDVLMAAIHRAYGLTGIVAAAILVLLIAFAALDRLLVYRGSGPLLAFVLTSFAAGVTLIHWLARPHLLSIPLIILWCAIVEGYRRRRNRSILLLPLLLALWANLHGAFVATFPMLLVYAVGEAAEFAVRGRWRSGELRSVLGTYALVAALSAVATLATPYGVKLYAHLLQYLGDERLLASILEFQSPNFHEIEGKTLEVLLLLAIAAAVNALREGRCVEAGLVLLWAHMTLQSKRHVAIAAVVLIPIIAEQWSKLSREAGDLLAAGEDPWRVRWRALRERYRAFLAVDRQLPGLIVYPLALTFLLVAANGSWTDPLIPAHFDAKKYPVAAADFIANQLPTGHVYAHDQYGSYLIYRFYPRLKVFVDGRSDFYRQGPVLADMLKLSLVAPSWQKILDGYDVQWMVLRRDEPLALIAEMSGRWANLYRDETAQIMVRKDGPNAETVASP